MAALRATLKKWSNDARTLHDAAASQVIARAAEARKIKQAALTTPDATVPMSKIDVAELADDIERVAAHRAIRAKADAHALFVHLQRRRKPCQGRWLKARDAKRV